MAPVPSTGGDAQTVVRARALATVDDIREILAGVPDPEIPAISVVDLGIVRDVEQRDGAFVITLTPTYSGCPATAVISFEISEALRRAGVENFRLVTRLSPAWTTDWISAEGCEKLKAFGIAPPAGGARCVGDLKNPVVECPHCGSMATEQVSRFGSTPCKAHWRCRDCLEPFDYFKSF